MHTHKRTIEALTLAVHVHERDIVEGECRAPSHCMEKIAIERALRLVDPKTDHKVRVDSSGVKFNYDGYRFTAPLPPVTKRAMLLFDSEEVLQKRAEKTGEAFQSKVRPHRYKLIAVKGTKIIPMTPERQKQINEARRRRIAAGHPDKQAYTLHERVIGMATSV